MKKHTKILLLVSLILIMVALIVACTPNMDGTGDDVCAHENKSGCICNKCGLTLHEIAPGDCTCSNCGYEYHQYEDCVCSLCGKTNHEVKDCVCTICGKEIHTPDENCICTICNYIAHTVDDDCVCTVCEETAHVSSGAYCRHDDLVYFGEYPKSQITDMEEYLILLSICGTDTPSLQNGWKSYGYYDGGVKSNYSLYKDIEIYGEKFRAVYHTKYRPYASNLTATPDNSYMDECGVQLNTIYFFVYEPIEWRVFKDNEGELIIHTTGILDYQAFQNLTATEYSVLYGGTKVDAFANWENSSIREWLNEDFYNTAVESSERPFVKVTEYDFSNQGYEQNITNDMIALTHSNQARVMEAEDKIKNPTDYAISQGHGTIILWQSVADYKNAWMIGNPVTWMSNDNYEMPYIGSGGAINYFFRDTNTGMVCGISPMMTLKTEGEELENNENTLVVRDRAGNVVSGIEVKISDSVGEIGKYSSNNKGEITFTANNSVVFVEIITLPNGYESDKNKYEFKINKDELTIVVNKEYTYKVTVVDQNGVPIDSVGIKLGDAEGGYSPMSATDFNGAVTISSKIGSGVFVMLTSISPRVELVERNVLNIKKYYFEEGGSELTINLTLVHPYAGYNLGEDMSETKVEILDKSAGSVTHTIGDLVSGKKGVVIFFTDGTNYAERVNTFNNLHAGSTEWEMIVIDPEGFTGGKDFINTYPGSDAYTIKFGANNFNLYYYLGKGEGTNYPMLVIIDGEGNLVYNQNLTVSEESEIAEIIGEYIK